MIEICNSAYCTGCSLCAVSCPKNCISMEKTDNFGHLFPVINQMECINCGLCRNLCPSINKPEKKEIKECYAAWAKNSEEYKSSSSGGASAVLSKFFINNGGVVYGCAMLRNVEVKHIRVDNLDDLPKLKGSKYVQSRIDDVLPQIKQDVTDGKPVLFTGTPCQCEAVKRLFKHQPENLFLVDLVCHGVPSLEFLKKHVRSKIETTNADNVLFREGNKFIISIVVDGKTEYQMPLFEHPYKDLYYNTFINGYTYRDSCYHCQYACPKRAFDITIGDFWGLGSQESTIEIPEHQYGCSVILPSSDKGINLVNSIKDEMNIYPRHIEEAVSGNDRLRHPFKPNFRVNLFRFLVKCGFTPRIYKFVNGDRIIKHKLRQILNN